MLLRPQENPFYPRKKNVRERDKRLHGRHGLSERCYYAVSGALMLASIMLLSPAYAQDNRSSQGVEGVLYVYGVLTESACRLEMDSARQDIALGEHEPGRLRQAGDRGKAVRFELHLVDCLRSSASGGDIPTGTLTWVNSQPAVSVSFQGFQDADNPQLVRVLGVSGLGLRMEDGRGDDVRLGSRGKPLLLKQGQNTLTYTVAPELTSANQMAGSYRAVVDFHLNYD